MHTRAHTHMGDSSQSSTGGHFSTKLDHVTPLLQTPRRSPPPSGTPPQALLSLGEPAPAPAHPSPCIRHSRSFSPNPFLPALGTHRTPPASGLAKPCTLHKARSQRQRHLLREAFPARHREGHLCHPRPGPSIRDSAKDTPKPRQGRSAGLSV